MATQSHTKNQIQASKIHQPTLPSHPLQNKKTHHIIPLKHNNNTTQNPLTSPTLQKSKQSQTIHTKPTNQSNPNPPQKQQCKQTPNLSQQTPTQTPKQTNTPKLSPKTTSNTQTN